VRRRGYITGVALGANVLMAQAKQATYSMAETKDRRGVVSTRSSPTVILYNTHGSSLDSHNNIDQGEYWSRATAASSQRREFFGDMIFLTGIFLFPSRRTPTTPTTVLTDRPTLLSAKLRTKFRF
jgi:hypothetical protein